MTWVALLYFASPRDAAGIAKAHPSGNTRGTTEAMRAGCIRAWRHNLPASRREMLEGVGKGGPE